MTPGIIATFVVISVLAACYALFAPVRATDTPAQPGPRPQRQGAFEKYVRPTVANFLPQTPAALTEYARRNDKIRTLLARTGNPWNVTPEEYLGVRVLSVVGGAMLVLLGAVVGYLPLDVAAAAGAGAFVGFIAPKALLDSTWAKRRRDLNRRLPEALDLLRISMDSGLSFANALDQTVSLLPASLTRDELARVRAEIRAGRTEVAALTNLATRCPTDEVEAFVRAVGQGSATGVGMAQTLAYQAEETRANYERMVEVRAQKLQTTLFLPLIGLFLPVLMLIIFAPAVTGLMGAL